MAEGVAASTGASCANDYLRLVIGLRGLEAVLLVAIAWLLGGLAGLRGLLPATLAAIVGGIVAVAGHRPDPRRGGRGTGPSRRSRC